MFKVTKLVRPKVKIQTEHSGNAKFIHTLFFCDSTKSRDTRNINRENRPVTRPPGQRTSRGNTHTVVCECSVGSRENVQRAKASFKHGTEERGNKIVIERRQWTKDQLLG